LKLLTLSNFEDVKILTCGCNPFGKVFLKVSVYFVDGLLIDAGQTRMKNEIVDFVNTLSVEQICITHHHEDHTGNLRPIKQHFDVPVYGSLKCKELMRNPPPISLPQKVYWGNRPAFDIIPLKNRVVKTSKYTFQIIDIPGHSVDMIALYEASKGWLFSGDLYINSTIRYMLKEESIAWQIKSIKKVLQLDFGTLFCGHNFQPNGGKEKLKEKLLFLEQFYFEVTNWYKKGYSAKAIFKNDKIGN